MAFLPSNALVFVKVAQWSPCKR